MTKVVRTTATALLSKKRPCDGCVCQFLPKHNWNRIFCTEPYWSIFNHCDAISLLSPIEFGKITQNKGYCTRPFKVIDFQACRGYEIIHPYPYPYPQIFRGYPWIYPYPQMPIIYRLTYRPMHLISPKCRWFLLFDIDYRNSDIDTIFDK